MRDGEYWSSDKIILIVVLIEHTLMIIKIVIAAVIPDVPESV